MNQKNKSVIFAYVRLHNRTIKDILALHDIGSEVPIDCGAQFFKKYVMELKIKEEFKKLIPPLTAEEFKQLETNCIEQ